MSFSVIIRSIRPWASHITVFQPMTIDYVTLLYSPEMRENAAHLDYFPVPQCQVLLNYWFESSTAYELRHSNLYYYCYYYYYYEAQRKTQLCDLPDSAR